MTVTPALQTISVQLSTNPYPVVIGEGGLKELGPQIAAQGIKSGTKVLVVTNAVVEGHYGSAALRSLEAAGFEPTLLVVEAGEAQKTPATVAQIHDAAFHQKLERSSLKIGRAHV